ncbi:uncharacterized protein LOC126847394 [Adelges cooleyi]|uniref:uncharacterized protein LOC126847394 n=1 Tax=Adelges cooleyi TaxID=133065 RepID=UPI00217F410B|nr:uncharacterized protein LOC126847394 [Adelges cooleyi]
MMLLSTECKTTAAIDARSAIWLITVMVTVACSDATTVPSDAPDCGSETINVKAAIQNLYAAIKAFNDSPGVRDGDKVSLDDAVVAKAKYVLNSLLKMVSDREPLLPEVRSTAAAASSDDRRLRSLGRKFTVTSWLQGLDLRGVSKMDGLMAKGVKMALASDTPLSVTNAGDTMYTHTQVQSRAGQMDIQVLGTRLLNVLKELDDIKRRCEIQKARSKINFSSFSCRNLGARRCIN